MAQHIVKLTPKQVAKLTQIQADKRLIEIREGDFLEIILDNAGISLPVNSLVFDKDQLIITIEPKVDPEPVKEEKVPITE